MQGLSCWHTATLLLLQCRAASLPSVGGAGPPNQRPPKGRVLPDQRPHWTDSEYVVPSQVYATSIVKLSWDPPPHSFHNVTGMPKSLCSNLWSTNFIAHCKYLLAHLLVVLCTMADWQVTDWLTLPVTQVAASLKKLYNLGVHLTRLPQVKLPSTHSKRLFHPVFCRPPLPPSHNLIQHQLKVTMDSLQDKVPHFLIQQGCTP